MFCLILAVADQWSVVASALLAAIAVAIGIALAVECWKCKNFKKENDTQSKRITSLEAEVSSKTAHLQQTVNQLEAQKLSFKPQLMT